MAVRSQKSTAQVLSDSFISAGSYDMEDLQRQEDAASKMRPLTDEQKDLRHTVSLLSPYFAEFMGCLLQALAWNSVELGAQYQTKHNEGQVEVWRMWKPVVQGLTLMVSTYCFASVSGAHLNPAVSFAVGLSNKGVWYNLFKYMLAQFMGSFSGVFLSCAVYSKKLTSDVGPIPPFHMGAVWLTEFGFTAFLCYVFLNVTLSRKNNPVKDGNQFYALAIGLAVLAGCASTEDVSGAMLNPGLALAVDAQNGNWGYGITYAIIEMMAAFVAAVAFRITRPYEEENDFDTFLRMVHVEKTDMNSKKLLCEGFGTFIVVATFGLTALSKDYSMLRPLAAGAALASMHYAVWDVSGGYLNPAVTFSVMLSGRKKLRFSHGCMYIAVQIIGAAFACVVFQSIYSAQSKVLDVMVENKVEIDGQSQTYGDASFVAAVSAFLVCYVALAVMTVRGPMVAYHGLAYGFASAAGGFIVINLSNSLANPALMLGTGLTTSFVRWFFGDGKHGPEPFSIAIIDFVKSCAVAGSHFFGAACASFVFRITHASDFERYFKDEGKPLMDKDDDDSCRDVKVRRVSGDSTHFGNIETAF